MSWKKHSTRVVYENPWMQVCEDRVTNPGGGQNDYGHIRFKNIAVAILAIDDNEQTWLVGQDRYTLGQYSWELPMGGSPIGVDPLDGARRELSEETGLEARSWTELMRLHPSNSITDELGIVYLATDLTQGEPNPEESENITVRRVSVDEAVNMAIEGQITDAISVAALLRYAVAE